MKKTIKIEGMHCSHCSARVTNALSELGLSASVDLQNGTVVVEGVKLPEDAVLRDTIEDLGFEFVSIA